VRVLICGSRYFKNYRYFARTMREIDDRYGPFKVVIHGGASGTDFFAHLWANSPLGAREEIEFKADWTAHGKSAGPIRNQKMLDNGNPDLVVAFPGGRGTADMVRRAKAAKVPIVEVPPEVVT
jgi:hypothetical protein